MRAIAYTRPGIGVVDIPEPKLSSPTSVKIKMSYASLCGSDLHQLAGDFDYLMPNDSRPVPLGHEGSGVIVELGAEATAKGLKLGDKVTFYFNEYCGSCHWCRNGQEQFCPAVVTRMAYMADHIVMEEQQVFKLADDADMVAAALIEPVSVALRSLELARPKIGATVAVFGGGGIGQITARLAAKAGAASVTLFEPVAAKRAIAKDWGVQNVLDPTDPEAAEQARALTDGRGFDVVMECAGAGAAVRSSLDLVARGGTVVLAATYSPEAKLEIPIHKAFLDEVTVVTGVMQSPYLFPRSVAIHGHLGLRDLVTVYSPEDYQKAVDDQRTGDTVKAVFDFTN